MEQHIHSIKPNYKLAICELYHPYFHGYLNDENNRTKKYIYNSYLVASYIEQEEQFDNDLYPTNNSGPWGLSRHRSCPQSNHPYIRNYTNIVKTYSVEIVQPIHLNTGHAICIPKTFWLKIFQRKYKKYYKNLQKRISHAKNPKLLMHRQITGIRI